MLTDALTGRSSGGLTPFRMFQIATGGGGAAAAAGFAAVDGGSTVGGDKM